MALQIKTTGVEDFLDGSHNIKMLVIGGPGVGKTRMASYWPKPFYADCESGRASVADRGVAYVEVHDSKDMLAFLNYCKSLEGTPKAQRKFQTIVIDTLDGFMRSVKDEWLEKTNSGEFRGYDAWGYLDTKMGMLMARLLNLDYNVIVNVHYKTTTVVENGKETTVYELQLSGSLRQTVFNDFDLVGLLDSFHVAEGGERVERRGLTFTPTQRWPELKDRLNVTPKWMPVDFADTDYTQFMDAITQRMTSSDFTAAEVLGEVPGEAETPPPATVMPPASGGPVAPASSATTTAAPTPDEPVTDVPLEKMGKQELLEVARARGIEVKGNMLKAEILTLLNAPEEAPAAAEETPVQDEPVEPEPAPVADADVDPWVEDPITDAAPEEDAPPIDDTPMALTPKAEPPQTPSDPTKVCADCGKDLAGEKPDFVKLSYIKYRRYLCEEDYQKNKAAATK